MCQLISSNLLSCGKSGAFHYLFVPFLFVFAWVSCVGSSSLESLLCNSFGQAGVSSSRIVGAGDCVSLRVDHPLIHHYD